MHKYIFSPMFLFLDETDLADNPDEPMEEELLEQLKSGEIVVLKSLFREKLFFINPTIHAFLQIFKEPKTKEEATTELAKIAGCEESQIVEHVKSFLSRMKKRRILIRFDQLEREKEILTIIQSDKEKLGFLKPGDTFKGYLVKDVLSIRKETQLFILQDDTEKTYVLKSVCLPEEMPDSLQQEIKDKFAKELEMLSFLEGHSAICKLVDSDFSENIVYGILEHINGISLKKFVLNNPLDMEQKLKLILDTIDIISYIQDKGVLHGDIHGSNFMMENDARVRMIDFGLSNFVEPEEGEILRNGGKSHFIPPERVSFNSFKFLVQPPDIKSEVFQLGVLAYFILYSKMPFKGFTWRDMANNIKNQEPIFDEKCSNGGVIALEVIAILQKALEKDPEQRYVNAKTLFTELSKTVDSIKKTSIKL